MFISLNLTDMRQILIHAVHVEYRIMFYVSKYVPIS